MSEEEVEKKLAEKNQEIYINKLLKDLDQNYENLKIVIQNIINVFTMELINKTNEIIIEDESVTAREDVSERIKKFSMFLQNFIISCLDNNKKAFESTIMENNFMKYVNQIDSMVGTLCTSLKAFYLKETLSLLNDLSNGLSDFSCTRLNSLINEILLNRFIVKVKSELINVNMLLLNNYRENNIHLEHMNEKTGVAGL